jgi:hypothetical protein
VRYRRAVRTVLLLVTAVLAAGCTTAVEGTPSAAPPAPLPARPREVRLDGVDPCSLLTPAQRAALGLQTAPRNSTSYVELFRGSVSSCTMLGFKPDAVGIGISTVTTAGIERWQDNDIAAEVQPTSVADFPAVVAVPTRYTTYCSVEVDVATGQLLDVQFSDGGRHPPIRQDELCRRAEQVAEAAMSTLLTS